MALAESGISQQYAACVAQDRGRAFGILSHCVAEETRRQDLRLNAALQQALKSLSPARSRVLQKAQRAWIKYQQTHCSVYVDKDGGQQTTVNTDICIMNMTAARARELEALFINQEV